MCDLYLDTVETGCNLVRGTYGEAIDHRSDIVVIHCFGGMVTGWFGHLRRRPHQVRRLLE